MSDRRYVGYAGIFHQYKTPEFYAQPRIFLGTRQRLYCCEYRSGSPTCLNDVAVVYRIHFDVVYMAHVNFIIYTQGYLGHRRSGTRQTIYCCDYLFYDMNRISLDGLTQWSTSNGHFLYGPPQTRGKFAKSQANLYTGPTGTRRSSHYAVIK